ncbi:MAG: endonuclease [Segetibacter sp.]|nr:endonuclease [Segetibacter sp.]
MTSNHHGEIWKEVNFDFEFTNEYRLQVSNFGRIKTFNKLSNGNELKGSMIKGYRIIRLKFFKPRDAKIQAKISELQQQIINLKQRLKLLKQQGAQQSQLDATAQLLTETTKKLGKQFKIDSKDRTINYHSLVHKLVAEYFCMRPSEDHTVVAHLNYDKLNNRSSNLKWMTSAENFVHQQNSPNVIAGKKERKLKKNSKVAKLTVTKVMLLKKLLNAGKPLRTLVKQFKITDTQILRIKRGENWAEIPAAN